MEIQHEVDQAPFQAGSLPHQGHKAALGNPHGAFGVDQLQTFRDLPVLLQSLLFTGRSPAAHLNVVVLACAVRTIVSGKIGEGQQLILEL